MRVSTPQFYFQNVMQINNKQADVSDQITHISSGKRIMTAKDDAIGYATLNGYNNELANIEKYQRNITQATNRNELQENAFANAENTLQQLKTLFIQANNGTLSDLDLKALSDLAGNHLDEMLNIGNIRDETGGYIFSGYQVEKKPFARQPDNSVIYYGDNGVRELQIDKNVLVPVNQSGEAAFEKVPNATGDFSAIYNTNTSGIRVNYANVQNRGNYNTTANPPNYTFNFTSPTDLTVTDGGGATVFTTAAYVPGQTIAFNGVEVQIDGNPLPGDNFSLQPQETISVFQTIKDAIDWMNVGAIPANAEQHKVNYDTILSQIESALNHMTSRRSEAGNNLKLIENQSNKHADQSLFLQKARSSLEDLDYASAVAKYEQSQVALQAAQKTFTDIKDMSLFNFI